MLYDRFITRKSNCLLRRPRLLDYELPFVVNFLYEAILVVVVIVFSIKISFV